MRRVCRGDEGFNSLFEMRQEEGETYEDVLKRVSILYLRCTTGTSSGFPSTMNLSLVSILYLRCWPKLPPAGHALTSLYFSILYLRCRALGLAIMGGANSSRVSILYLRCRIETPFYVRGGFRLEVSILYLRCAEAGGPIFPLLVVGDQFQFSI